MKSFFWALLAVWSLGVGPVSAQTQGSVCPPVANDAPAFIAHAAQHASNRGFLWRIERDGRASYLYGSLHVGKAEWMAPGPDMRKALLAVDTVALEVDMSSEASQRQWEAVRRAPQRALPPSLQQRLAQWWAAECLPPEQLANGPVELQATALVALSGRRQGFDPAFSSELFLTIFAKARKLPLVSLESMKLQLDLVLASNNAEAIEMVSGVLDQLEKPNSRAMQERLIQAWALNDLPVLEHYTDWCDCVHTARERADLKKLLDDRNPGLADAIERLHASGKRVFSAVGALHMTGPLALPRLMAARGFAVERVY